MLSISELNQFYGESHILWDINVDIKKGECICLMGRNGVGKTTLLKSIMGMLPIKEGSINFDGVELAGKDAAIRARQGIGYVPQGREIFPQLTVEENLKIGLSSRRDNVREVPEHIYEMFPVLKQMLKRRGGDLSGGQQQQLAIGRALVLDPKLLILDEPTSGLDPNQIVEIRQIIKNIGKEKTIILSTHILSEAEATCDRIVIINRGKIVADGSTESLKESAVDKKIYHPFIKI